MDKKKRRHLCTAPNINRSNINEISNNILTLYIGPKKKKKLKKKLKEDSTAEDMGEIKKLLGDLNSNIQMMKNEMDKKKDLDEGIEKLKVELEERKKDNEISMEMKKIKELGMLVNSIKDDIKVIKNEKMCVIN